MDYLEVKEQIKQKLPNPIDFKDTENLLELGLSSLVVMRIVNQWRKQGIKVSFGSLMEHPTFQEWWGLIQNAAKKTTAKKPKIRKGKNDIEDMHQEFPLTDVQYAYWVGRDDGQVLGGVGCHAYLEFDGESVDPERLQRAWNIVQYHHSMLRDCFPGNGLQKILSKPYSEKLPINDFSSLSEAEAEKAALSVRDRLSHRKLQIEKGEVAGIELTLLPQRKTRVHIDIDLLVADVQSLHIILRDLATAYNGGQLLDESKSWNFAAYLQEQEESVCFLNYPGQCPGLQSVSHPALQHRFHRSGPPDREERASLRYGDKRKPQRQVSLPRDVWKVVLLYLLYVQVHGADRKYR